MKKGSGQRRGLCNAEGRVHNAELRCDGGPVTLKLHGFKNQTWFMFVGEGFYALTFVYGRAQRPAPTENFGWFITSNPKEPIITM